MQQNALFTKALAGDNLTCIEGVELFNHTNVRELLALANEIRYKFIPEKKVSWQIDRNVNYTNICISGCLFCNFHCTISQKERGYTITPGELRTKIEELRKLGGDQLLLQGGLHPLYDITYYENLFQEIKSTDPLIKLNALGPPEVAHIARISKLTIKETLSRLVAAGLDTLPGAGAEILSDRVRKILSPGKPDSKQWADVMREAHRMGIGTTATMVYGHIETIEERIEHLILLRDIQAEKPLGTPGFRAFICWPMQNTGTKLGERYKTEASNPVEHLKMVAISRIILNNISHIQASWLTIGMETGQLALHSGADDMGSIMIEENVVSSAGVKNRMDAQRMQQTIREAGFEPWLRNQDYTPR
ncbi:MAG: dehypoxanthine futalosine cyclase [Bacteroidetes bacterium GWF2_40_14]|nr:MAG: dehypoxanthine futalosine cyclase [Bacteroidetes bacterium GWF2_40_14]